VDVAGERADPRPFSHRPETVCGGRVAFAASSSRDPMIRISSNCPDRWSEAAAQVTSVLKPWVMCGGVVLTTAIAIAMLADVRIPLVSGGTELMHLAALMIWAGR
jgi:hypothetical protein